MNEVTKTLNHLLQDAGSGVMGIMPDTITSHDVMGAVKAYTENKDTNGDITLIDLWHFTPDGEILTISNYLEDGDIAHTFNKSILEQKTITGLLSSICPLSNPSDGYKPEMKYLPSIIMMESRNKALCFGINRFDKYPGNDLDGNIDTIFVDMEGDGMVTRQSGISDVYAYDIHTAFYGDSECNLAICDSLSEPYDVSVKVDDFGTWADIEYKYDKPVDMSTYGLKYLGKIVENECEMDFFKIFESDKDFTKEFVPCPIMLTSSGFICVSLESKLLPFRITVVNEEGRYVYNFLYSE